MFLNVREKKKIKEGVGGGGGIEIGWTLCGGEKQEKRKRKKEMKTYG